MGQPLNAVVWLAHALKAEGQRLKVGDWISLGSYSALMPPQPGQQIRVDYKGLEGAQPVELRFE
jgi:2-keto-4-pentenoate hydratase